MLKILAPIDGSSNAARVIEYLVHIASRPTNVEVHVINVREPIEAPQVQRFWNAEQIGEFQQKEGDLLLAAARQRLAAAGIPYTAEVVIGDIAQTIADQARSKDCDLIVMGSRGMGTIASLLLGSIATKVVHLAEVPVTLVK